jgi:hypothetical protein
MLIIVDSRVRNILSGYYIYPYLRMRLFSIWLLTTIILLIFTFRTLKSGVE